MADEGAIRADVIVIGGGIAGLSAAAHLAPHARVVLLEAEDALAYHASGRSAALYVEDYGNAAVRALNRASRSALEAEQVLSPRGFLVVGPAGRDGAFDRICADMGATPVTDGEARARVPILSPVVARAGYREDVFDLDTDRLCQSCARRIRSDGGRIVPGAGVTAISRAGDAWHLETRSGAWTAPTLVNAAGAWADHIAAMAGVATLGLVPCRRSMARLPAPGGHDVTGWPFVLDMDETWYAKPDAGKWLVSPAEEDPVEAMDAWADDMVLAKGLARYEAMVTDPVTRVETSWAGLRSFVADRTPVLGRDPAAPDFVWCAGQGGYGFQTAPAAGRLLADLVLGRAPDLPSEIVSALSPARPTLQAKPGR